MVRIVGVRIGREEALLGVVSDAEAELFEANDFFGARQVEASDLDDVMPVLVLGEQQGLRLDLEFVAEESIPAVDPAELVDRCLDLAEIYFTVFHRLSPSWLVARKLPLPEVGTVTLIRQSKGASKFVNSPFALTNTVMFSF